MEDKILTRKLLGIALLLLAGFAGQFLLNVFDLLWFLVLPLGLAIILVVVWLESGDSEGFTEWVKNNFSLK